MEKDKLRDICYYALDSFNLPSHGEEYPFSINLKGPLKHIKSFQLVLFLMEVESKLDAEVDLFDLIDSMGGDICGRDLIDRLLVL